MEKLIRLYTPDNGVTFNREGIGKKTILVCDCHTDIVYYQFEEYKGSYGCYTGFMAPYISENGKLCRFVRPKLVEIG